MALSWFNSFKKLLLEENNRVESKVLEDSDISGTSRPGEIYKTYKIDVDPGTYNGRYGKCAEFLMNCDNIFSRTSFSDTEKVNVLLKSCVGKAKQCVGVAISKGKRSYKELCSEL